VTHAFLVRNITEAWQSTASLRWSQCDITFGSEPIEASSWLLFNGSHLEAFSRAFLLTFFAA
jgi:hypothetical protein